MVSAICIAQLAQQKAANIVVEGGGAQGVFDRTQGIQHRTPNLKRAIIRQDTHEFAIQIVRRTEWHHKEPDHFWAPVKSQPPLQRNNN